MKLNGSFNCIMDWAARQIIINIMEEKLVYTTVSVGQIVGVLLVFKGKVQHWYLDAFI